MTRKLTITIGHLYPNELNLYGDMGNIEALENRLSMYGFTVNYVPISSGKDNLKNTFSACDILFMGGGPDSLQKEIYTDLLEYKSSYIKEYYENNGVGLFVCGAYQLLGLYYKSFMGDKIPGLSLANFYTEHPGLNSSRCVGNVIVDTSRQVFSKPNYNFLVGFENHGGRTFFNEGEQVLGRVVQGIGNNEKDKTEGWVGRNFYGTYLHGPILPKNPHLSHFLISTAVALKNPGIPVPPFKASPFEEASYRTSLKLKR